MVGTIPLSMVELVVVAGVVHVTLEIGEATTADQVEASVGDELLEVHFSERRLDTQFMNCPRNLLP